MRLNIILNLYALKVKVFFGAFRTSKASIALLLIYILGYFPGMFGISSIITNAVKHGGIDAYFCINILSAAASALIAVSILLSLKGGHSFWA